MGDSTRLPLEVELLLTIRFSASVPDILLEIPNPTNTTTAGLKQRLRSKLPADISAHRLRLIHAGKALEDEATLATQLRLTNNKINNNNSNNYYRSDHELGSLSHSHPPSPNIASEPGTLDSLDGVTDNRKGNGKGKTPVRDPPQQRIYIHCSIGDIILSPAELAAEARLSSTVSTSAQRDRGRSSKLYPPLSPGSSNVSGSVGLDQHGDGTGETSGSTVTTTTPAPRGFDRLLSAGFTASEVSSLRSQFIALISRTHTPDTLPSGTELRRLEDRWMDEDSGVGGEDSNVFGDSGGGGGGGGLISTHSGALDDMLWGSVMGFFWPVGCALWLLREEGVWSWRKGLAVFVGVVVNFGFGAMRMMS